MEKIKRIINKEKNVSNYFSYFVLKKLKIWLEFHTYLFVNNNF